MEERELDTSLVSRFFPKHKYEVVSKALEYALPLLFHIATLCSTICCNWLIHSSTMNSCELIPNAQLNC